MCSVLAFVAFSLIGRQGKISFKTEARPAFVVIRELGAKLGRKLAVSNALASEPLIIAVNDASSDELLRKIAEVTHAVWERDGEVETLTRPPALEKQLAKEEIAAEGVRIRAGVDKFLKSPAVNRPFTAKDAASLATQTERLMNPEDNSLRVTPEIQALMDRSPAYRALGRIIAKLDPQDIAAALRGGTAVFSTNPNRMQRPLPGGTDQILSDLLAEHELFVKATEEYRQQNVRPESYFSVWGVSRGEWMSGKPNLGIGKALLQVFRLGDGIGLGLTVGDPNGKALVQAFAQLDEASVEPTPISVPAQEPAITNSPLSQEVTDILVHPVSQTGSMEMVAGGPKGEKRLRIPPAMQSPDKPISPELLAFITRPEQHDPMSLGTTEVLAALAKDSHLNLVADVDDRCWMSVQRALLKGVTPGSIVNSAGFQVRNTVAIQPGWLTASPRDPVLATVNRTNRPALAVLLKHLNDQKYLSLDQISQFSLSQVKPVDNQDLELSYMRMLNAGAANRAYQRQDWLMYRVYGSISPQQRDILLRGGSVRWINLSPIAKSNLDTLVFQGGSPADMIMPDGKKVSSSSEPVLGDWTELLPNGLNDIEITVKGTFEPALLSVNSHTGASEFASVSTVAGFEYVRETPSLMKYSSNLPSYDRFTEATVSKIAFHFATSPSVSFERELKDGSTKPGAVAVDAIPADFRTKVSAELAELRSAFGNMTSGGPPPPIVTVGSH